MMRASILRNRLPLLSLALALLALAVFFAHDAPPTAQAQQPPAEGSLDTTFGTGGKVITDVTSGNDQGYAVAVQPDNKIVVVGFGINSGTGADFALVRYNPNGSLDTDFGTGGKVTTNISGNDVAYAVALQPDNKIVVAGYATNSGTGKDFALARYNPDGSLDTDFGTSGKVTTAIASGNVVDEAFAVAVQSDGDIVVAGDANGDFGVARYNANGTLDTDFNSNGKVTTDFASGSDIARAVAVLDGNNVLVAGNALSSSTGQDFALARYNSDGSLDSSFSSDGKVTTAIAAGSANDLAHAMAVLSDGDIVLAGQAGGDFGLARYNANGALDTGFGTGGKVTTDFSGGEDIASGVAVQADGKIVAAGHSVLTATSRDFALARYNADGSLDTSFGTGGKVTTAMASGTGEDRARGVALQADGNIVAAGRAGNQFAVARYHGTPTASNADLSDLTAEGSTDGSTFAALTGADALAPAFDAGTTAYRATVGNGTTHVRLTPTVAVTGSTVKVGLAGSTLTTVTSGTASGAIPLAEGDNQITVEVTASDSTTQEYTVTVRRVPSGSAWHATLVVDDGVTWRGFRALAAGQITDDDFTYGGVDYTVVRVTESGGNILVQLNKAIPADLKAALTLNFGSTSFPLADATLSNSDKTASWTNSGLSWSVGDTISLFLTPAQTTTSSDADLSALTAEGSTDGSAFAALTGANALAPAFDAATTAYRATVGNDITHVRLTPTAADSGATVQVRKGTTGNFGPASAAIPLDVGANAITVRVTGQDSTTKDYTVTIRRVPAGSVWHATLTVEDLTSSTTDAFGCRRTASGGECSTTTVLSDDDFTYGGVDYEIHGLYVVSGTLKLTANKAIPSSLKSALTLNVGSTAFSLASGTTATDFNVNDSLNWSSTGLTWSAGDLVSLSLAVQERTPTVSLAASPNPVNEGSSVTITATLSQPLTGSVTIPLTITGGTAEPGDYGTPGSITISAGDTAGTRTITTAQDPGDQHETFTVSLGTLPSSVAPGSPSSVTVTIRDDEAPVPVWEATLTVANTLTVGALVINGCDNDVTGAECSTTAVLTDDEFTYNGVDYDAVAIRLNTAGDLDFQLDRTIPADLKGSLVLHVDGARFALADSAFRSQQLVRWSNTGLNWSVGDVVRLSLFEVPIDVAYWSPEFKVGEPGGGYLGCRNGTAAPCSAPGVLGDHDFRYTRNVYGHTDGRYTWTYKVLELYRTSDQWINELVLVTSPRLPDDFVLTVLDRRDSDTPREFRLSEATREVTPEGYTKATWRFNGRAWAPHRFNRAQTILELGMKHPRGGLDAVFVHYDGITDDHPDGVDGFQHLAVALRATYGLKVNVSKEFISIDPNYRDNPVTTTHVKLRMYPVNAGSTLRVKQRDFDVEENGSTTTLTFNWQTANQGGLSQAIRLDQARQYTYADIEVTDGDVTKTYLLAIDPPPRTYSLTPAARVTEGQDATLTLTLSEPAPPGGAEFTVSAGYGSASSDDVGTVPSPVTVPWGDTSVEIAVPTVDDDRREAEESFTVTVAPAAPGWGVDPGKTGTATVTIEDNDLGPEPRDVRVVPGNGTLTVSWTVAPREGVEDGDIRHALRWSQEPGVWANPKDPKNVGKNDGITVAGGVTSYLITGLRNDVATGVFVRSYTGKFHDERAQQSSDWVRVKGDHTTPRGDGQRQPATANQAPTVSAAIADLTIVNESGTKRVSLSGVFDDTDGDTLTITAASSETAKATVSVASDGSSLTVSARGRGTATITVTANDGNGGTVSDTFTVTVKAAPTVSTPISDVSGLEVGSTKNVSLAGVFSDADGDALTITASSSDETKATVTVSSDGSKLTLTGVAVGSVTVTVTARDSDGNTVSDSFDAPVARKYAGLIANMKEWRNDTRYKNDKAHTNRWDRALLAFGETVADQTLTPMPADEAQGYANRGWTRWVPVAAALRELQNRAPTVSGAIADATIVNESGTHQVSLAGVFDDPDNDSLTITASSSDTTRATVSVASGYSSLTVSAKGRGTATITVTADDGNGGTVDDTFHVTVKAAPVVASAIADVSGLEVEGSQEVPLAGVFSDPDGDSLTITAASSDETKAAVTVASDGSKLTLTGVAEGTATVTVTARDSDGNQVSDAFDVAVEPESEESEDEQETPAGAPTVVSPLDDLSLEVREHQIISLAGVFTDPDGDDLTISAEASENSVVIMFLNLPDLVVVGNTEGTVTITVTAEDPDGNKVSDSFEVTVRPAS